MEKPSLRIQWAHNWIHRRLWQLARTMDRLSKQLEANPMMIIAFATTSLVMERHHRQSLRQLEILRDLTGERAYADALRILGEGLADVIRIRSVANPEAPAEPTFPQFIASTLGSMHYNDRLSEKEASAGLIRLHHGYASAAQLVESAHNHETGGALGWVAWPYRALKK